MMTLGMKSVSNRTTAATVTEVQVEGRAAIGDRIAWAIHDGLGWLFEHPLVFWTVFALWLAAKVIHAS